MTAEPYPHIFYNARWSGYLGLLFGLSFLAMAIVGLVSQRSKELGGLFFLLIAGVFIRLGWRTVTDDKPVLQFGRDGIWTRKLGAISWQGITLKYRAVSNPKSGSIESLIILDERTQQQLDWVPLTTINESTDKVKELLASCKSAKILK